MTEPEEEIRSRVLRNEITKEGDKVTGIYDSESIYVKIEYINKLDRDRGPKSKTILDIETMFRAMEALDRRKGRS